MIITVSGDAGTGTTTLAKHLSQTLGIPYSHAGAIFRQLAEQKNIPLLELIKAAEHDFSLDQHVESELLKLMQSNADLIVEGRLTSYQAWKHQIPSFRILLTASPHIQAQRISVREGTDYEQTLQDVQYRDHQDWMRYQKLYGISIDQQNTWNSLVVNTDNLSIEETYQTCLLALKAVL